MSSIQSRMSMGNTAYNGASNKRRPTRTWRPISGNSDTDDLPSLAQLRIKSRDAYRNQTLPRSAINTKVINTVGSGLMLQPNINRNFLGMDDDDATDWERKTEFEFKLWADSKNCDAERTKDFYEQQGVAFVSTLLSGDVVALTPLIDRGSTYSLAIQLIEADRISNPNNAMDKEELAGGVEVDGYGAPIAYHISKHHPGGISANVKKWSRIESYGRESGRTNVIHLFEKLRPGQRRGVPILAPVMENLKQLENYTNAELESALVSGLYAVFIKSEASEGATDAVDEEDRVTENDLELTPGMIAELKPGEDITTSNPGRPNPNYDPFVMSIIKQIGAALDVPFEMLLKHFSASYSASRAALLEAWKVFKARRIWFARNFCQPIYVEFLYEAILMGRIIAPGFLEDEAIRKAYCGAEWNGPTPGQLDPVKETSAAIMRADAGFSTRTKETAEMNGGDFEQNCDTAKRENIKISEAGLKPVDRGSYISEEEIPTKKENDD